MDDKLSTLTTTLDAASDRMRSGRHAADRIWPTGFGALDPAIGGGLRSGSLVLLAGPAGLGKTTFALQVCRNVVRLGRPILYFSYEHEAEDLLAKLVSLEAGELDDSDQARLSAIQEAFDALEGGTIEQRLDGVPYANQALGVVRDYSPLLFVHRSTGSSTGLAAIRDAAEAVQRESGVMPLIVVDYLQKVHVPHAPAEEEERSTVVVEGLKDLAIDLSAPVLAVVAADKVGMEPGRRMRLNHLRGSSALAYEADIVMVLNSKFDIVARHHLTYDLGNAERFREWAVVTVEKNRFGRSLELEYRKRFDQGRFETTGRRISEQLVDERVFME
ncbi:DnaB-like helicase C-terminal domain-containing protein [Nocardioides gansuensis]|uniref:DnaB-like helicase C-terminal domain-containing protein n=1 Tax=Nocardioides gansuensis TaxID=2138300 RepID=UPI001403C00C|nr:DnaB-like helicase C-terminal domain-containing protein [Nocardioides gansuensis]